MTAYSVHVTGIPAPQGSKRAYIIPAKGPRKARANLVESSSAVKPWRAAVVRDWTAAGHPTATGAVTVAIDFRLPRPKAHYGTGRNAGKIRAAVRRLWHVKKPDLDKLVRSTLDGLTTAGAYLDDSAVVALSVWKEYVEDGEEPGARVVVFHMQERTL